MTATILRAKAVATQMGYRCTASVYNLINAGLLTRQISLGERASGWPAAEVDQISQARCSGIGTEALKELVNHLHAQRVERLAQITGGLSK